MEQYRHDLALRFAGDEVRAFIDGIQVANVTGATYDHGQVGLMLDSAQTCAAPPKCPDSYVNAQFDDFTVAP